VFSGFAREGCTYATLRYKEVTEAAGGTTLSDKHDRFRGASSARAIRALIDTPTEEFLAHRGEINTAGLSADEINAALDARRDLPRPLLPIERDILLALLGHAPCEGPRTTTTITKEEPPMSKSQAPDQSKGSQDHEQFTKGKVPASFAPAPRGESPPNEGASKLFDKSGNVKQNRDGSGWPRGM
jgi:hypothetical protein